MLADPLCPSINRGFETLFCRFLIVYIIINRRFKNLQSVQSKNNSSKSKAMHTNGTVAAVFCFPELAVFCELSARVSRADFYVASKASP